MNDLGIVFVLAFAAPVIVSIHYWPLTCLYLKRWLAEARIPQDQEQPLPPVTFLRPVKRDTPRLTENLERLVQAMRTGDQLLLGVDAGSEAAAVCETIRARFPEKDIAIVACVSEVAVNPKISKLIQMTPHARHEHWILSDSESVLDASFLAAFRHEWTASKTDVLTAGYRFVNLETWPQQLDAAAALFTLWPGLAVLRRSGRVRLTLGACTAFRRGDVEAIGGFPEVGDQLAEDNRLGVVLAGAGRTVRLSAHVVTLASDTLSWRDYWRHQRRVAVTYRVSNRAGFAASIVTHGLSIGALIMVLPHPMALGLGAPLFLGAWAMRWVTAHAAARMLDFTMPRLGRVVLLASFVETACWIASWFSWRVWWSGRWWGVSGTGRLSQL